MAKEVTYVQVGKHKLELSNLQKVLYPDDHILKAEVLQYYLKIAPTILSHIKERPLSLVRFPDGVEGERFFQKNKPDWAPNWIESVKLGVEVKDYMMANEEATLVWLANLACLELHQMHAKRPHHDKPDYIVYDLDPPEQYDFEELKSIAFKLKDHIESFGYQVFVKTTGGKGLHLVTPVLPRWTFEECFNAAKAIAQPFVEKNANTTLQIKKDARKGRVLIDIYRNRTSQTIVAPYSLRGYEGAPVSMPLTWEELEDIESAQDFNIENALDKILEDGDAWQALPAYAEELHTHRKEKAKPKKLGPNARHKTPEQLEDYSKKRNFKKTPEPQGLYEGGDDTGFVIHRHHASHLHYDLRLEQNGVLRSWAVPKGMPPYPGIKRLAVATEDHPMKYIAFEGEIPKGQYGGGNMWIYANGRYEITKEKKDGFYFALHSPQVNAEYRMHKMKDKEWLLERVDNPQLDWLKHPVEPMLADSAENVPSGEEYVYEVKWDGIRALIVLDEGELNIYSRNHKLLNKQFPELMIPAEAFRVTSGVFDGEIVCFDSAGRPNFKNVIHRMQRTADGDIQRSMKKYPAFCYLFDCLMLDGRPLVNDPLIRRREWLEDSVRKGGSYRISETVEEGQELFDAAKKMQLEGIMAKDINSRYIPGKRSAGWIKVKVRQSAEALIIGYTEGRGDRQELFGALQLAEWVDGELVYRGKVGTGFNSKSMKELYDGLKEKKKIKRPVEEKPLDDAKTTWIEPQLYAEIQYSMLTHNGTYREPVFLRLRPDLV